MLHSLLHETLQTVKTVHSCLLLCLYASTLKLLDVCLSHKLRCILQCAIIDLVQEDQSQTHLRVHEFGILGTKHWDLIYNLACIKLTVAHLQNAPVSM